MINKSNEFTRRILNFPAIRPCESVSFSTILASLINLSHSIRGFKSKPVFTNKKNAKTSIHLIETLVIFLDEIKQNENPVSSQHSSMLLCLSELHFIFQKIHFLLQDCARDDSRLWLVVESEKVSSHFRDMIRAITVALDILPLVELGISDDVRQIVEFVKKQALKVNFEVGKDERRATRRVFRIVDQFETGIAPEPSDLKRVLECLGIKTWNECNNEIRLLESLTGQAIEFEATGKNNDFQILSSLIAFLIYCRCTVFENVDASVRSCSVRSCSVVVSQRYESETIRSLKPDDFKCPISLEIMMDPVTISTGHTYDRFSILKWFESGNHTCPKTGQRLISVDLVPNLALKRVIRGYCRENGIAFPESGGHFHNFRKSSAGPGSAAAEQATEILAHFLVGRIVAGATDEQIGKACYEIRLLTKTSDFNRSRLVEAGAIPPLLNMLRSTNLETQENSTAALLNLSKNSEGKRIIVENRGLEMIVGVLTNGVAKSETRGHAAGALFYLASIEEYRNAIGKLPGSIAGLVDLIRAATGRGRKNALAAVLGLLVHPENHRRVLSAGSVRLLVDSVLKSRDQREEIVTGSLAVLAALAEKPEGATAIVSAGGLPVIIEILSCSDYSYSRAAKEYCISVLLALCTNDGTDVVPVLVANASRIMVDLYSVLTGGSSRSSKKAGSLIRILHAFDEKRSDGFRPEQIVHVW